jgi:DNA-binding NarL/FixJ family response regulator
MPIRLSIEATEARALPSCPSHPDSLVRRYRSHGLSGPGVYPQCVPAGREQPHLLAWPPTRPEANPTTTTRARLSPTELVVLLDAAAGLTVTESATSHHKSLQTVKSQRKAILLKLGARNITQAVGIAIHEQLLTDQHAA